MSVHPDFLAASEAAEQSLEFLSAAEAMAKQGEQRKAREYFNAVAMLASSRLGGVFEEMKTELAGVAEGKITRHGPNGTYHFASAHEAISSLWLSVALLTDSARPDLLEWLGYETSVLRTHLLRERARLMSQRPNKAGARRVGRPQLTPVEKTLSALTLHHGYENGTVTNYEPATNRGISTKYNLPNNALTRFLQKHGGSKKYNAACRNSSIGLLLAKWNNEEPSRSYELRDEDGAKPLVDESE